MLLTAIEMEKRGLTFASVHDSYWTHASQVDQMNETLRSQFIALHNQPLLEQVSFFLAFVELVTVYTIDTDVHTAARVFQCQLSGSYLPSASQEGIP
jgi:hypothetical protein